MSDNVSMASQSPHKSSTRKPPTGVLKKDPPLPRAQADALSAFESAIRDATNYDDVRERGPSRHTAVRLLDLLLTFTMPAALITTHQHHSAQAIEINVVTAILDMECWNLKLSAPDAARAIFNNVKTDIHAHLAAFQFELAKHQIYLILCETRGIKRFLRLRASVIEDVIYTFVDTAMRASKMAASEDQKSQLIPILLVGCLREESPSTTVQSLVDRLFEILDEDTPAAPDEHIFDGAEEMLAGEHSLYAFFLRSLLPSRRSATARPVVPKSDATEVDTPREVFLKKPVSRSSPHKFTGSTRPGYAATTKASSSKDTILHGKIAKSPAKEEDKPSRIARRVSTVATKIQEAEERSFVVGKESIGIAEASGGLGRRRSVGSAHVGKVAGGGGRRESGVRRKSVRFGEE